MRKMITTLTLILIFVCSGTVYAEQEKQPNLDDGYAAIGEALMGAKQNDWNEVKQASDLFSDFANKLKENSKHKKEVQAVKKQAGLLRSQVKNRDSWNSVKKTLMEASRSLREYDEALHPVDKEKERAKLSVLLPITEKLAHALEGKDLKNAQSAYEELNRTWTSKESIVRSDSVASYGAIETSLAFMRIGFEQKPENIEQIKSGNEDFAKAVKAFMDGTESSSAKKTTHELNDVVALLEKSEKAIDEKDAKGAVEPLQDIIRIWPSVEGEVRIKDSGLYADVENQVPAAIGKLQSENPKYKEATNITKDLANRLKLMSAHTSYNFVDAMLILLREGIEAILVVAGLVAFLKRANNGVGKKWVWGGAAAGIIASLMLAVVLVMFFANAAGAQNREVVEGVIGIAAVLMMLSIGAWLHKRSNILNWNAYFEKNMGKAIAGGSLLSMAGLSFLAIFREGAETIIFYIGMAPAIELQQLLLGIALALATLIVLGFAIIRYSSKIPLRPFFAAAAWLIYILAFKMIGASIHALQVANIMPVHVTDAVPFVQWLGIYPTVETLLPQILLIALICLTSIHLKRTAKVARA